MKSPHNDLLGFAARNSGPISATLIFFILFSGYGGYEYHQLYGKNKNNENTIVELQNSLKVSEDARAAAQLENEGLRANLLSEQERNNNFANQLNALGADVGNLVKLSKTDKELLQKYSKVYFLNENYIPSNLTGINPRFSNVQDKIPQVHTNVWPFLERLLNDAEASGMGIKIQSAYRSFGTQSTLKQSYKITYGAGTANNFSAEQGYSEHQLGTTVDFTTAAVGSALSGFDKDKAYQWLRSNAHRYGFTLSYPPNNSYYQFEPWHWRFVGVALATRLHNEGKYFYDLDQRVIDEYLINIFD